VHPSNRRVESHAEKYMTETDRVWHYGAPRHGRDGAAYFRHGAARSRPAAAGRMRRMTLTGAVAVGVAAALRAVIRRTCCKGGALGGESHV
jgi:hypothetical protein